MLITLGLAIASACPPCNADQAPVGATSGLTLMSLGDWGDDDTDNDRPQVQTATAMGKVARQLNANGVLLLGDNFYDDGVKKSDSKRFDTTFEDVYKKSEFGDMKFYAITGNHDHHNDHAKYQVQHYKSNPNGRWYMPNLWYSQTFSWTASTNDPRSLHIVMIDTVTLAGGDNDVDNCGREQRSTTPTNLTAASDEYDWIDEELKSSTADFLLVVGHYGIYSAGSDGGYEELQKHLLPKLKKYGAHYMSGHDHMLQHIVHDDVNMFVNGIGMECCYSASTLDEVPKGAIKYMIEGKHGQGSKNIGGKPDNKVEGGFASLAFGDEHWTVTYYDQDGRQLHQAPPIARRTGIPSPPPPTPPSGEPGRVIVPRGIGWGNSAWPDNGAHDLASDAGYAYIEVDIFGENSIETDELKKYKDAGHLVFCYFSIGTLEEGRLDGQCKISGDKATCKENQELWRELTVRKMGDWNEVWLDIENPKLRDIMGKRIKMAKDAGCHGIEPDNIDCYDNDKCKKSKSAQKDFNKWTVDYAHSLGLSVCAKNVNEFMSDIPYDCAVVEQAFQYGDDKDWQSFASESAVFAIEYKTKYGKCSKAEDSGFSLIYCDGSDNCDEKTKMTHCRKDSSFPQITCTSGSYDTQAKSCSSSAPTPPSRRRAPTPPSRRRAPTPPSRRRAPTPPTRRRSPPPTPTDWCTEGIYKSNKGVGVCCAKQCGQCGGTGCGSFPGGKWNCCADALAVDGDDCEVPEDTGCRIPSSMQII